VWDLRLHSLLIESHVNDPDVPLIIARRARPFQHALSQGFYPAVWISGATIHCTYAMFSPWLFALPAMPFSAGCIVLPLTQ
jgi:hypothetical protein